MGTTGADDAARSVAQGIVTPECEVEGCNYLHPDERARLL